VLLGVTLHELHQQAVQRIVLCVAKLSSEALEIASILVLVFEEALRRLEYCVPISAGKVDEWYQRFFRLHERNRFE
jgi:hypothetical protein